MDANCSPLPSLPDAVVEKIQLHAIRLYTTQQPLQGPDPRRYVFPFVNKQWNKCLQLAPRAWDVVCVQNEDIWSAERSSASTSSSSSVFSSTGLRVKRWFDLGGRSIRSLNIDLNLREFNRHCTPKTLEELLLSMLCAVEETLESLSMRVLGAPMATAHVWIQTASQKQALNCIAWPHLRTLELEIDGGDGSQASASYAAAQVLYTLHKFPKLCKASFIFTKVKICVLPAALREAEQLTELSLTLLGNTCRKGGVPIQRPEALPLPPNLRKLTMKNFIFAQEDLMVLAPQVCKHLEQFTATMSDEVGQSQQLHG